jgi:hypothetical protein
MAASLGVKCVLLLRGGYGYSSFLIFYHLCNKTVPDSVFSYVKST